MFRRLFLPAILITISFSAYAQFSTSAQNLEKHVYTLASDSLLGRGFGTEQGQKAARYIAAQFEKAGIEPLGGNYFHPFNYRTGILNIGGTNVAGIIPGSDPGLKDEYIILGAHFDHLGWKFKGGDTVVYNGADDNASGTASIIEIGRNLASTQELLGRSIVFVAFDGEESGLVGSKHFLRSGVIPADKMKLMFSLDMVGMYEAHGGLDMVGVKLLNESEMLTGELASAHGITIRKANAYVEQRTDTAPFGAAGIPALAPNTGSESPYHKPEDDAPALDYDGMALIANYISALTMELSTKDQISDKKAPQEEQAISAGRKPFRVGLKTNLGSGKHDYKEEFYQGKAIFNAAGGVMANLRVSRLISLQPEVLYETKGSRALDGTFRSHSITTPLNIQISNPDDGNGMVRTFFHIGGYYSYHFGGKIGDVNIDFQNQYTEHEYGLSYGFGVEIMRVQWGLYIQKGLSSLLQDSNAGGVMNENVYFTLGFFF